MSVALDVLVMIGILVIWHACYMWFYPKVKNILGYDLSNWQNLFLFIITPIIIPVTSLYLLTIKFLNFLEKE